MKWKASLNSNQIGILEQMAKSSVANIFAQIEANQILGVYSTGGQQAAETTVTWPMLAAEQRFKTTLQQHSEMVALDFMLTSGNWLLGAAGRVNPPPGGGMIGPGNFKTDLPHCAHCTTFLFVLGLPLGNPTKGRYNQAVNLGYTLPSTVMNSATLLSLLWNSNSSANDSHWIALKQAISVFFNDKPESWALEMGPNQFVTENGVTQVAPVDRQTARWNDIQKHVVVVSDPTYGQVPLLNQLWKFIFKGIYLVTN